MEPSESYETFKEHVDSLFFATNVRRMNKTNLVLYMTSTEDKNFVLELHSNQGRCHPLQKKQATIDRG